MIESVKIPIDNFVYVTGIKLNMECKNNSSHSWGVYLNADGSLPEGWNVCIKCFSKNRSNILNVKGDVNYGRKFSE